VTLPSGTLFYRNVEGWGILDSLYFSVITLANVGYGDLAPTTAAGKVFTILYIFVGIGIILGFVNTVAERSLQSRREGRDPH
jgi:voltage-gated potassium channel